MSMSSGGADARPGAAALKSSKREDHTTTPEPRKRPGLEPNKTAVGPQPSPSPTAGAGRANNPNPARNPYAAPIGGGALPGLAGFARLQPAMTAPAATPRAAAPARGPAAPTALAQPHRAVAAHPSQQPMTARPAPVAAPTPRPAVGEERRQQTQAEPQDDADAWPTEHRFSRARGAAADAAPASAAAFNRGFERPVSGDAERAPGGDGERAVSAPHEALEAFSADELRRYLDAPETAQQQGEAPREDAAAFADGEDDGFPTEFDNPARHSAHQVAVDPFAGSHASDRFPASPGAHDEDYGDYRRHEHESAFATGEGGAGAQPREHAFGDFSNFAQAGERESAAEAEAAYGGSFNHTHDASFGDDAPSNYQSGSYHDASLGEEAPASGGGVQPFEARYDQHPEIPIGAYPQAQTAQDAHDQAFFQGDHGDAEFLADTEPEPRRRFGRKRVVALAAIIGALGVGGALAYTVMGGGQEVATVAGKAPLIQADERPIKVSPADPGGKEFPHKNKLIYDRLQGEEQAPQQERLVPRQEEVATGAPDGQRLALNDPAASDATTASTREAAIEEATQTRRVRTLVVRPDGSVVQPGADSGAAVPPPPPIATAGPGMSVVLPGAPSTGAPVATATRTVPVAGARTGETRTAAVTNADTQTDAESVTAPVRRPAPESVPAAAQQDAPSQAATQTARATPGARAASDSGSYVIQVAARRSQTDALAAFADLQQRYPELLSGYRPIIERADLGSKGTWYRLRVGPMQTKTAAVSLCDKLQAAGLKGCLVYEQ